MVGEHEGRTEPMFTLDRAGRQDPSQAMLEYAKQNAAQFQTASCKLLHPGDCFDTDSVKHSRRAFHFVI
jgi:hypothetical protein